MTEPANPELLSALGRLVRGLSALFWGLPIALIVCVQTAKSDWIRPLGYLPPILSTGLLLYGLSLLGHFQKQERVWRAALDRAKIFSLINVGLAPFLVWWNRLPSQPFYGLMVELLCVCGVLFLFALNPVLWRLTAMLPDETLRAETKTFTRLNRYVLSATLVLLVGYFVLAQIDPLPKSLLPIATLLDRVGLLAVLLLTLLPVAMTMALIWKTKEVILSSVFGPGL
jgi:hypothetical protein